MTRSTSFCRWFRALFYSSLLALSIQHAMADGFQGPVNAAVIDRQSITIIVPTHEQDKEAEREITKCAKRVRDQFFTPDTPLMTDTQALGENLSSRTLLVYGTWQGNSWLSSKIRAFPIEIHPDKIVTNKTIPGTNLRLISAWPNPQNPAKGVVIFTAQQAKDIVNINSVFHGPADFTVASGDTVVQAVNYLKEKPWKVPKEPKALSLEAALADLDCLFKTIEEVHPNPLARKSRAQYDRFRNECQQTLTKSAAEDKTVPMAALAMTTAKAAAFFDDGHTVSYPLPKFLDFLDPSSVMLPFFLDRENGRFTVGHVSPNLKSLEGLSFVRINGHSTNVALAPIMELISGEAEEFKYHIFLMNQTVYWNLVRPIRSTPVRLALLEKNGKAFETTISLVSAMEHAALYPSLPKSAPSKTALGNVEFRDRRNICYWQYYSFVETESALKQVDDLFAELQRKKTSNLIIDLRANGGGNSDAAVHILRYLAADKFRMYSRVERKISNPYLAQRGNDNARQLGKVISSAGSFIKPLPGGKRFKGKVYVLTGPATFSTAADFTAVDKDYGIGKIIGEETGGMRQCFGDKLSFELPNSKISFSVSCKIFFAPKPKPGDDRHGTEPDIHLNAELLKPFAKTKDPAVEFVLHQITQTGQTK